LKIATYNVNSIRTRLARVLEWMEDEKPDVVCFQETKVTEDRFPRLEFEAMGYKVEALGQKAYNGVAIAARSEIGDVIRGLPGDEEARLLAGTVAGTRVISVYVPNGREVGSKHYVRKLEWLERLRKFLDERFDPEEPVVMCGDYNIAPEDRDVYDPERWRGKNLCSEPERAAFRKLLDWGFTDALRLYTQEPEIYTWWDYRQGMFWRNQGLRIDHHLITAPLTLRLDGVEVRRELRKGEKPSDHVAVVALLD
jgi:exodeoxyribonuclease-3